MSEHIESHYEALLLKTCIQPRVDSNSGHLIRCGSRIEAVCPSCAALYRGDWSQILRSGVFGGDSNPVPGYEWYFITLTAPSFGQVHKRVVKNGVVQVCHPRACGKRHGENDPGVGAPLWPDRYDFQGQMEFNHGVSRLLTNTVAKWRKGLGVPLQYFVVFEVQARGVLHAHAIIRVPTGAMDGRIVRDAIDEATRKHEGSANLLHWGKQTDIQRLDFFEAPAEVGGTVKYVMKAVSYTLKSVNTVTRRQSNMARMISNFARHSYKCGPECGKWVCKACQDGHPELCEERCSAQASPARCKAVIHRRVAGSQKPLSFSTGSKVRGEVGWSFTSLTRTKIKQGRQNYMAGIDQSGKPDGGAVEGSEAKLQRAERIRGHHEANKWLPYRVLKNGEKRYLGA